MALGQVSRETYGHLAERQSLADCRFPRHRLYPAQTAGLRQGRQGLIEQQAGQVYIAAKHDLELGESDGGENQCLELFVAILGLGTTPADKRRDVGHDEKAGRIASGCSRPRLHIGIEGALGQSPAESRKSHRRSGRRDHARGPTSRPEKRGWPCGARCRFKWPLDAEMPALVVQHMHAGRVEEDAAFLVARWRDRGATTFLLLSQIRQKLFPERPSMKMLEAVQALRDPKDFAHEMVEAGYGNTVIERVMHEFMIDAAALDEPDSLVGMSPD